MSVFETVVLRPGLPGVRSARFLVEGAIEAFSLPGNGPYVIGRGNDANILVRHASVSRRHAQLVFQGNLVTLGDLGSANGTRVGSTSLQPELEEAVDFGTPFFVGSVLGVVIEASATDRAAFMLGRDSLIETIQKLLSQNRAIESAPAFSLAALRGDGIAEHFPVIAALVPSSAVVVATSESEIAVVLPGVSRIAAAILLEAIASQLASTSIARVGDAASNVAVQVKASPDDGATVAALWPEESVDTTDRASAQRAPVAPAGQPAPSPEMEAIDTLVQQVAPTPASVLIIGETGVGKEVWARRIHERSNRAHAPFMALNCAALAETLLESELFGHEKGAFTGAQAAKPGLIEAADGGTLFLDELGEMPPATQAKLLRVLEERAVMRVGSVKARPVDIRLVAATNRDLPEAIRLKQFRADLYYRINSIILKLPPLRERRDEIAPLAKAFAKSASELLKRPTPQLPAQVMALLEAYEWPGNIRELRNAVERLVVLARDGVASVAHLPEEVRGPAAAIAPAAASTSRQTMPAPEEVRASSVEDAVTVHDDGTIDDQIARIERKKILDALDAVAGNQTRAAELLGISRRALVGRMEKYKLPRPRR